MEGIEGATRKKVRRAMPDGTVGEFESEQEAQQAVNDWDSK